MSIHPPIQSRQGNILRFEWLQWTSISSVATYWISSRCVPLDCLSMSAGRSNVPGG